ncbi:hypothetical protein L9F63_008288, partial [Diploptera punctata]
FIGLITYLIISEMRTRRERSLTGETLILPEGRSFTANHSIFMLCFAALLDPENSDKSGE